jgi:integrase
VKFYRGAPKAARAYVERDRSRADDYYLGEGPGVAERLTATPDGVQYAGDRWLFDEGGRPWHDNLVDYRWRSTRRDAGLTFKLHDLRHYFASGLIAAGCDVVTVQRAMGHAAATTTLSTYAHLWPTAEDKTRAAASGMAAAVRSCHISATH